MFYFRITSLGYRDAHQKICHKCKNLVEEAEPKIDQDNQTTKHRAFPAPMSLIPGLDLKTKELAPFDKNLAPFQVDQRELRESGDARLSSMSTDNPSWAPGFCQNMHKYEGKFVHKISLPSPKVLSYWILYQHQCNISFFRTQAELRQLK